MSWLLLVAAYLIGAFPTSHVIATTIHGIDLRTRGSGNLGATNAFRVLGWRSAAPILLIDIFKGWLPTFLFARIDGAVGIGWALAYGAAAIVGHVFSVYVRFKGGKGVATGAGVFLALAPVAVFGALLVWAALVYTTGYVSLGSIVAAAILPVLIVVTLGIGPIFWLAAVIGSFVVYMHRKNVGRLLRGEEHPFRGRVTEAQ
jgi:glycerol-3-phosphate acyltransferase PlsY